MAYRSAAATVNIDSFDKRDDANTIGAVSEFAGFAGVFKAGFMARVPLNPDKRGASMPIWLYQVLFMIIVNDRPFYGYVSISPEPYQVILERVIDGSK